MPVLAGFDTVADRLRVLIGMTNRRVIVETGEVKHTPSAGTVNCNTMPILA
ncbi:hypothetical protein GIY56_11975 [Paracoccus sp. YIM 132242]|uniref:Uncharacterized protein n=1 Tax=Paracoccus lichenicola TaxID=2665644 RepID=A0A6L6HS07_9RHOB|nr:hypothetical protein [Paracoccus lichenicola]MTE01013.1 hypothetical protein [Paracoccus lichenicola]